MKENVLDVLMYLFENYMDSEIAMFPDQESLKTELMDAGFTNNEVDKAFDWLEGLASLKEDAINTIPVANNSIRIYTDHELKKITVECRGFLLFLEQIGVIDPIMRELVIDRVMALEGDEEIDIHQLKWVILMALFNQPGREAAFAWIEDQVFEDFAPVAH